MHVIELIQKKRDRRNLNKFEIDYLINSYVSGEIPDYQMSAFLMAIFLNGMDDEEVSFFTDAMLCSGEVVSHENNGLPIIDKHSTGGVGDKISIPLAPAAAACGLKVPMIAGRGLGHTGGTLDKLEAIPNFRADLSTQAYRALVAEHGCVIMGQTKEIAPADKLLYALRDVTGTVESIPLIASSIMSKKLAEGIDGLVLDVKFGSGAFMKDIERARLLANALVRIGRLMDKKVTTLITSMDQPIGKMVGNAHEIVESIEILQGRGPKDAVDLTVELGAEMLLLGKIASSIEDARIKMRQVLSNGKALAKFQQMIRAQGGDERVVDEPHRLVLAKNEIPIKAMQAGFIESLKSDELGLAVTVLGGGRQALTDRIDHSVGLVIHKKIGDRVEIGEPICTIHAQDRGVEEACRRVKNAIHLVPEAVTVPQLVHDRIALI